MDMKGSLREGRGMESRGEEVSKEKEVLGKGREGEGGREVTGYKGKSYRK